MPQVYVSVVARHEPTRETALDIMRFAREHLAPYKRVRRLEFAELPKTISDKIRRIELRTAEHKRLSRSAPAPAGAGRVLGGGLPGAASLTSLEWLGWDHLIADRAWLASSSKSRSENGSCGA